MLSGDVLVVTTLSAIVFSYLVVWSCLWVGFIWTILLFPLLPDRDQTRDPVQSTSFRARYFVLYLFSIICQNPRQIDQSQFLRGSWRPGWRMLMIDNQQVTQNITKYYKIFSFLHIFTYLGMQCYSTTVLESKYSTIAHLGKV